MRYNIQALKPHDLQGGTVPGDSQDELERVESFHFEEVYEKGVGDDGRRQKQQVLWWCGGVVVWWCCVVVGDVVVGGVVVWWCGGVVVLCGGG